MGSADVASAQNEAIDRRERLRRLALETIDLAKDPYFMRNHVGSYECKLCLTVHGNEGITWRTRRATSCSKAEPREKSHEGREGQPERPGCESLHPRDVRRSNRENREDWAARVSRRNSFVAGANGGAFCSRWITRRSKTG